MDLKNFKTIIKTLKSTSDRQNILYKNGVDLIEFSDNYHMIISLMFKEIYGESGKDWIDWFCYENDFGTGKLKAFYGDKEIIKSVTELWKYIEDNHKIKHESTYCANCQSSKENCVCKFIKK